MCYKLSTLIDSDAKNFQEVVKKKELHIQILDGDKHPNAFIDNINLLIKLINVMKKEKQYIWRHGIRYVYNFVQNYTINEINLLMYFIVKFFK